MVLRSAHARVGANVPTGSDGVERLSVRPTESACSRGAAIDGCPRTRGRLGPLLVPPTAGSVTPFGTLRARRSPSPQKRYGPVASQRATLSPETILPRPCATRCGDRGTLRHNEGQLAVRRFARPPTSSTGSVGGGDHAGWKGLGDCSLNVGGSTNTF
jgi:hypothetical protein